MSEVARPAVAPPAGMPPAGMPPAGMPTAGPGPDQDVSALSFEEALAELERIVRSLEGGQQKLEQAILAYERGTALRRHCEAKLMEVEGRVAAIVESGGTVTLRATD